MFAEFKLNTRNLWVLIVDLISVSLIVYYMLVSLPKTNLNSFNMFVATLLSIVMIYFGFAVGRPFIDKHIFKNGKDK
ncbi:hypothetical protein MX160_20890 [Bacillus cytotoxicus]|uniref:hypothetical protein n=1 Tax=Bacillus cytotoxicus TaxID=580165 RepID=UPI00244D652E|nr:hypothetical protein [Bacillus cytotoxicus]MDH2890405.1 hypothetical protein [Bacillus cytotoxicus]MDH2894488.1 hypothetical protein [Bacillus cytotoxicus]